MHIRRPLRRTRKMQGEVMKSLPTFKGGSFTTSGVAGAPYRIATRTPPNSNCVTHQSSGPGRTSPRQQRHHVRTTRRKQPHAILHTGQRKLSKAKLSKNDNKRERSDATTKNMTSRYGHCCSTTGKFSPTQPRGRITDTGGRRLYCTGRFGFKLAASIPARPNNMQRTHTA